jgi:hypothetical protein
MEVSCSLVRSLLLSVNLGLFLNESDARGITVCQLYLLNRPVYHLSKYTAVLHSISKWKVTANLQKYKKAQIGHFILAHKSTRFYRTKVVSPGLFVTTEFDCILNKKTVEFGKAMSYEFKWVPNILL